MSYISPTPVQADPADALLASPVHTPAPSVPRVSRFRRQPRVADTTSLTERTAP
jgi:hypothetical protein